MIGFRPGTKVWLAAGKTDMRKGFDGLAGGRMGDRVKVLYWDGQGMCLFYKRLDTKGSFVWPSATDGKIQITPAQLSTLLEGIDWRLTRAVPEAPQPTVLYHMFYGYAVARNIA